MIHYFQQLNASCVQMTNNWRIRCNCAIDKRQMEWNGMKCQFRNNCSYVFIYKITGCVLAIYKLKLSVWIAIGLNLFGFTPMFTIVIHFIYTVSVRFTTSIEYTCVFVSRREEGPLHNMKWICELFPPFIVILFQN